MKKKVTLFKRIIPFILGLGALLWFLVRVIPKPSRATYPCQRAAFPMASAFVLWVAACIASIGIIKRAGVLFKKQNLIKGFLFLILGTGIFITAKFVYFPEISFANSNERFVPTDAPNTPVGTAKGINPGRVVWVHDPDATSWNGYAQWWWDDKNTNQTVVNNMTEHSIQWLTGEEDMQKAWEAIFKYFNANHDKGDVGYTKGEKIAIKVNMNSCSGPNAPNNSSKTSPHIVLSYVSHLIDIVGVEQEDITIYDKSRHISKGIYDKVSAKYPEVKYMDDNGQSDKANWSADVVDFDSQIKWSQELTLEREGGNPTYLPKTISEASYIINMGNLKGHNLAGVTLCAKNHFGTFYAHSEEYNYYGPKAAGVHPYAVVHRFGTCGGTGKWDFCPREMGTYNTLVDLMGHKDLGGKTLLFILDALYCSKNQNGGTLPNKWSMEPFNNDWTSSIFISQDGVAIESVGLDFLRNEPTQNEVYGNVDNYLHEAAQAANPPSGTVYDPEDDGSPLENLGVHEHWNNATDKQYSRNLGTGNGIELVTSSSVITSTTQYTKKNDIIEVFPNPVYDKLTIQPKTNEELIIDLCTGSGIVIKSYRIQNKTQISMSGLASGIYFLKTSDSEETNCIKIIKK